MCAFFFIDTCLPDDWITGFSKAMHKRSPLIGPLEVVYKESRLAAVIASSLRPLRQAIHFCPVGGFIPIHHSIPPSYMIWLILLHFMRRHI